MSVENVTLAILSPVPSNNSTQESKKIDESSSSSFSCPNIPPIFPSLPELEEILHSLDLSVDQRVSLQRQLCFLTKVIDGLHFGPPPYAPKELLL